MNSSEQFRREPPETNNAPEVNYALSSNWTRFQQHLKEQLNDTECQQNQTLMRSIELQLIHLNYFLDALHEQGLADVELPPGTASLVIRVLKESVLFTKIGENRQSTKFKDPLATLQLIAAIKTLSGS